MIDVIKEVNRMPGYVPEGTIVSGRVVKLTADGKIKHYDLDGEPLGFALEDTQPADPNNIPTIRTQSSTARYIQDRPTGTFSASGVMYTEVNRGGLIGVLLGPGSVVGLMDDGRGPVYDPTKTYTLNSKVYAGPNGIITSDSTYTPEGGNPINLPAVGVVMKAPTASDSILVIKTLI